MSSPIKFDRYNLDVDDIVNLKPSSNHVLLRQLQDTSEIRFGKGKLSIDTTWKPEYHVNVIFEVVALPSELVYDRKRPQDDSMEWKTDMQLKVGDVVWVNYLAGLKSPMIEAGDDIYRLVKYEKIYCALRPWNPEQDRRKIIFPHSIFSEIPDQIMSNNFNHWREEGYILVDRDAKPRITGLNEEDRSLPDGVMCRREAVGKFDKLSYWKVLMLNGYVLFETVAKPDSDGKVKEWKKDNTLPYVGRVKYLGVPNEEYREEVWHDDDYIREGNLIHLLFNFRKDFENSLHAEFDGGQYYVTQRRFIQGVIKVKPELVWN